MTFSIVGCSVASGACGVAVASRFLAVGSAVPAAEAGVGALATQSYANLAYRPDGLRLLRAGRSASEVLRELTEADPERELRQLGVVGARGDAATFTGSGCHPWAGGMAGSGYAIQGNILAGEQVAAAMERAWLEAGEDAAMPRRLLAALVAGDAAGGDRRGRQSAALLVARAGAGYGGASDIEVDLRVDDAPQPVEELARLLELHELYFGEPVQADLLPLEGELADEVRGLLAARGHTDADLDAALSAWAGIENYEMRLRPGRIDPLVLERLRAPA